MKKISFINISYLNVLVKILVIFLLVGSCKQSGYKVEVPLNVIQKRDSLSKIVISYFESKKDTFQLNAARKLMDQIVYCYYFNGERQTSYINTINGLQGNKDVLLHKLDSLKMLNLSDGEIIFDVETISARYIIENIEDATTIFRKCKWKEQISFETFCNYLLPYRVNHEVIENWRGEIRNLFFKSHDSSFYNQDIEKASETVYNWINEHFRTFELYWGEKSLDLPDLTVPMMYRVPAGTCADLSIVGVNTMRALGIPASQDYVPLYLNRNNGHEWNAVVLGSGKSIPFAITNKWRVFKLDNEILAKVYRKAPFPVANNYFNLLGHNQDLPDPFNNPFLTDVTSEYKKVCDLSLKLFDSTKNSKVGYLCAYNRPNWVPVVAGIIKRGKLCCKDVPTGGVYLPVILEKNGLIQAANTILVDEGGGHKQLLADIRNPQSMTLLRKYPLSLMGAERMINGKFQGANTPDFSDAVDLYKIGKLPAMFYNSVKPDQPLSFRYLRYLSPVNSDCNIAELEFFSKKDTCNALKGKIIGTPGSWADMPSMVKGKAFDGDSNTFFDVDKEDAWVGLDLGKGRKAVISKLVFWPRNDDNSNSIKPGNIYELFYWNSNAWISLGKQTASSSKLIYNEAPAGALYLLKNHTEGVQERIFTYENGQQMWW